MVHLKIKILIIKVKKMSKALNFCFRKTKMFICEISIIIILIYQKLGSVGPVQQKIKLPSPNTEAHSTNN